MQQRRLRLGDILDDYCPRERRITNHAVVAMIDDQVKQTRCTTCDADHEYKQARVPSPRRKKSDSALADAADGLLRGRPAAEVEDVSEFEDAAGDAMDPGAPEPTAGEPAAEPVASEESSEMAASSDESRDEEGPVHRRLIRATLPRPEGQAPERKLPDFTIRQPGGRGAGRNGHRQGGGARRGAGGGGVGQSSRFGYGGSGQGGSGQGPRHGAGHGQGQGQRPQGRRSGGQPGGSRGPGQGGRGGGRKRGR